MESSFFFMPSPFRFFLYFHASMKKEKKIVFITIIIAAAILVFMALHDIARNEENLTNEYIIIGLGTVIFVILGLRLLKEKKHND